MTTVANSTELYSALSPEYTYIKAKVDFKEIDAKLMRFIELRNEMIMLADELKMEVDRGLIQLTKAEEK